jgi:hypothetical protein
MNILRVRVAEKNIKFQECAVMAINFASARS